MPLYRYLARVAGLAIILAVTGCARQLKAFYVSPFNGNNETYASIPTIDDSVRTAVYADLTYSWGTANDYGIDHFAGIRGAIHVAQQFQTFQAYYGLDLSLGSYSMGTWGALGISSNVAHADQLNAYSGTYSFGGAGFQAGFNGVVPIDHGEWRFLGIETSDTSEFGDYLETRRQMPDSIATLINRNALFASIGLTTEAIRYTRHGEFGCKWAFGVALGRRYLDPGVEDLVYKQQLHYTYFTICPHYAYQRWTAYLQLIKATETVGL